MEWVACSELMRTAWLQICHVLILTPRRVEVLAGWWGRNIRYGTGLARLADQSQREGGPAVINTGLRSAPRVSSMRTKWILITSTKQTRSWQDPARRTWPLGLARKVQGGLKARGLTSVRSSPSSTFRGWEAKSWPIQTRISSNYYIISNDGI